MNAAVRNFLESQIPGPLISRPPETNEPVTSSFVCRYQHFTTTWYRHWAAYLEHSRGESPTYPRFHRKDWEWIAVTQALVERGFAGPGSRGLGFAVGTEPLASLFAALGSEIVASDAPPAIGTGAGWAATNQHVTALDAIYRPTLIGRSEFNSRVSFVSVDMNGRFPFAPQSFDFTWSCCALEHLGDLDAGANFILRSAQLLRPGGVAVHTTEYNVSSNERTFERGDNVIYRRRDIERIDGLLRRNGYCLETMTFDAGEHEIDRRFDTPPYYHDTSRQHVKLLLGDFVATSIMLIVRG